MNVYVDPRTAYRYETYYLKGVETLFGKNAICYDIKPFVEIPYQNSRHLQQGTAFVFEDKGIQYKIFIDTQDVANIEQARYEWCDVYAKVNVCFGDVEKYSKLMVLGPQFGLRLKSPVSLIALCCRNYLKGKAYSTIAFKPLLQGYLYSYIRRRGIECYERPVEIKNNYIFHASTLWYNEFAWTNTNKFRGEFLKACRKAGIEIEGGLYYLGQQPDIQKEMPDYGRYETEYKDFIYTQRLGMDDYIGKTKESVLVFNTPAVCECHGWKLAEYLCMGKAIISTPLTREMPGEGLIHGENVHFVHSIDEIYDAVQKIKKDKAYQLKLEVGARRYYEEYLAPEVVIQRILTRLKVE